MEASPSRTGAVVKLGQYDGPGGVMVWEYLTGVVRVRGMGWLTHPASVNADDRDVFERITEGRLLHLRGNEPGPGETAGGFLHEVEYTTGETEVWWLNVPEAYLTNDRGGTIDKLQTGGGLVTTIDCQVTSDPLPFTTGQRTWGAADQGLNVQVGTVKL